MDERAVVDRIEDGDLAVVLAGMTQSSTLCQGTSCLKAVRQASVLRESIEDGRIVNARLDDEDTADRAAGR